MRVENMTTLAASANRAARRGLLLWVFLSACSTFVLSATDLRRTINFIREWKFQLGDVGGVGAATFDDSKWDDANLPRSFSMPYFVAERCYVGYTWHFL